MESDRICGKHLTRLRVLCRAEPETKRKMKGGRKFIHLGSIPRPLGRLYILRFSIFASGSFTSRVRAGVIPRCFASGIACSEAKILFRKFRLTVRCSALPEIASCFPLSPAAVHLRKSAFTFLIRKIEKRKKGFIVQDRWVSLFPHLLSADCGACGECFSCRILSEKTLRFRFWF